MTLVFRIAFLVTLGLIPVAHADGILDVYPGTGVTFDPSPVLFPNWVKAPTAGFMIYECDDLTCPFCPTSSIKGVTIYNYGTATGGGTGDITGLYYSYVCNGQISALQTLSYAGVWSVGAGNYPAWTWAGTLALTQDPCDPTNGCWCFPSLLVYSDINSCATDGASIILGPGYSAAGKGGVTDSCGLDGPTGPYTASEVDIGYIMKKSDPRVAAPGDTVNYTIYYGRPGTPTVSNLTITDTQPQYTHWNGVANPNPDSGWNPNPGPPLRLRWTFPGPLATTGGPTGAITFQLTVDWGNGDSFEPGSGDVAAPEGAFLRNSAQLSWSGNACASGRISSQVATVVSRYLVWEIGDNDILFASSLGQPSDEMIYSIFIKNSSSTKTWWNVSIWDTVPAELDVWTPGYGFDDPCTGWTMSPSGCASATPGRVLSPPSQTILTWRLDLPPMATIELKWKARVTTSASPGDTALNNLSLLEMGRTGIVDGTGHQGKAKNFVHLAPIMLRTTYISFAGFGGGGTGKLGMFIEFYPLNRATDFQLLGYEAQSADPWVNTGGVSPSIIKPIGTCTGGFSCAAGYPGGLGNGCKAERTPADYSCWSGGTPRGQPYGTSQPCGASIGMADACSSVPSNPYHHIYKVVANSPVLWQLFSCNGNNAHTFTPSTSLSFSGFVHYAFARVDFGGSSPGVNMFNVMNTSVDPWNNLDPDLTTTVHLFTWDYGTLSWVYQETYELDKESQVMTYPMPICNVHCRFISSSAKLVIRQAQADTFFSSESNWDSFSPARNGGTLTSNVAGEAFYIFPCMKPGYYNVQAVVTNVGAVDATYRIEVYKPIDTINHPLEVPSWMAGTSGVWLPRSTHTVKAGFPAWGANWTLRNPHIYGTDPSADPSYLFTEAPSGEGGIYRIVLLSGGPIEVDQGADVLSVYGGGSLMHPTTSGQQAGTEFWLGMGYQWLFSGSPCGTAPDNFTYSVDIFCAKNGTVVRETTDDNAYSATYTTNGSDQCVAFRNIATVTSGGHRIVKWQSTNPVIAMYNECQPSHKFFTAPFVQVGVHYMIIAPPVAYVGQNFWITIVVVEAAGGTKNDYVGTTSFTSTDPKAQIQSSAMDSYNYAWILANAGVKIFINVNFSQLGLQTLIAADTLDGSITGITGIMIVGADVKLEKRQKLSVAASGDTVQFQICWSNYSSATAYSFTITDAVPMGTTYVPELASLAMCMASGPVPGFSMAASASTTTTPPTNFATVNPGSTAGGTTRWLRWTIRDAYVNSSGCVCFKVVVN